MDLDVHIDGGIWTAMYNIHEGQRHRINGQNASSMIIREF